MAYFIRIPLPFISAFLTTLLAQLEPSFVTLAPNTCFGGAALAEFLN
jgi:hypothetical protein